MDAHYRNAFFRCWRRHKCAHAFDIASESESVRELYGRTKIGGRCLMARRLVEAGARFVMVDYGYDPEYGNLWDNHNAPSQQSIRCCAKWPNGRTTSPAWIGPSPHCSEISKHAACWPGRLWYSLPSFGRTPTINKNGGRGPWDQPQRVLRRRRHEARRHRREPIATAPIRRRNPTPPADVAASIYRALGIDTVFRLRDRENRPHFVLAGRSGHPRLSLNDHTDALIVAGERPA